MRDRICPDTVTLWSKGPEDDNRKATWNRHVLIGVHWEEGRGARTGAQGDSTSSSFLLMARPAIVDAVSFTKGDKVSLGTVEGNKPPKGAHTITHCEPVRRGGSVDHYEVTGE